MSGRAEQVIRLEHGSGGALSRRLVEELIYPRLRNREFLELADATPLSVSGTPCMTTDSYVVDPPFFPGGDIGKLSVFGTCNDLAVSGARPLYLSLAFVLEEGFPIESLKTVLDSIASACDEAEVVVVTGDTKVVPKGKGGGVFINTAGIGVLECAHPLSPSRIRPGDRVLVSGPLGAHGITVLAAREKLPVGAALRSDCASLYPLCKSVLASTSGVRVLRDATRGGVAAVLNELVSGVGGAVPGLGIEVDETAVPVDADVRAASDLLGLSPLEIANEGVVVAVTASEAAETVVEAMRSHAEGRAAAVIGEVTHDGRAKVWVRTEVGGLRLLDMPRGLLLPRIC